MKTSRKSNIQSRLLVTFSVIFLVGVLSLSGFLWLTSSLITYNADARQLFIQTQKTYNLQDTLEKLKINQVIYETEADVTEQVDFVSFASRMDDQLQDLIDDENRLQDEMSADILAGLQKLQQERLDYLNLFDQIVAARDNQDYEQMLQLSQQAGQTTASMSAGIEKINQIWLDELKGVESDVDIFTTLAWIALLLTLPLFVFIVMIAADVIQNQINRPLAMIEQAVKEIRTGVFKPASLNSLAMRSDEVGRLTIEFLQMAAAAANRRIILQAQADEIKTKIH